MSSRFNLSRSGPEDAVEYETLSSNVSNVIERPERLHEWLSHKQIEALQRKFKTRPGETMGYLDLREELESLNISFTDLEYNRLFLKINQNRDFRLDWNEFVSYLIFGFQDDEASTQKEALILPISTPPVIRKSEHRSPVCTIALLKAIPDYIPEEEEALIADKIAIPEDSPDATGMWLTASHEGQIRFWTPNLEFVRSSTSQSIHLKMATWILAMQALSDVNIVCTSSTERELRFHETVASTFTLRIVVRSMPYAVCCTNYSFHPSGKVPSRLVLGDYGGNVRILEFSPYLRGPFQSKPGAALIDVLWQDIIRGKLPAFKPKEYVNFHTEIVQSVYFSMRLNYLFAAAEYRNTRKYRGRCPGLIVVANDTKISFRIPLGVTTFYVDEKNHLLVTGGPDTFIRIWDVYIPSEPSGILTGHNSGIVYVFIQPEERKVYSVDYQKIIKIWHLQEHTLLQTFGDIARLIPFEMDLCYFYHAHLRCLLVGGRKLISIKCSPRIRVDLTDGNTHAGPVSVVLYNRLFRNVVTCGLDSNIIVWDPWTGYRKIIMKSCHSKIAYGESYDIEITAATFDPLEQFLLTGARDGSLKIWNYNNAVCLRNMRIRDEHEVTAVIWVVERILAFGWDRQVTEFNDVEGREYSDPKKWPTFHSDDITCADVKLGEGVVTATYSGEIIFWKLETGQPYRRYNVSEPYKFIELKHNATDEDAEAPAQQARALNMNITRYVRKSISDNIRNLENAYRKKASFSGKGLESHPDSPRGSENTALPESVQAVLFLQSRPMTKSHGSVLVALDTGYIQVYSHHQRGGYLSKFNAIHKTGDCVLTMATDRKNRYLFTGTAFGYIKIWHIQNYCVPDEDKTPISMPLLRLQFIFLSRDRFLTRAKRVVRYQPEPLLLSSYKAHLRAINSIAYVGLPRILITGSHDHSVRLWSLGGRYLGTLGTPLEWQRLSPFTPVFEERIFRLPPDIKKVASSTTIKVISGQSTEKQIAVADKRVEERNETEDVDTGTYAKPLKEPILGKHFALPGRGAVEQIIKLDTSQSYWPVYSHLKLHDTEELHCPPTPPIIEQVANEEFMDYYMPPKPDEYAEVDDSGYVQKRQSLEQEGPYKEPSLQRLSKFTQSPPEYRKTKVILKKILPVGQAPPPPKPEKEKD